MALATVFLATIVLARPASALALPACTAGEIIGHDPGCPSGTGPCTLTLGIVASGVDCTFDFGDRDVVVGTGLAPASLAAGAFSRIKVVAASLRVRTMAAIETGSAARIEIATLGDLLVDGGKEAGRIDDGPLGFATIGIWAGGDVVVAGSVDAGALPDQVNGSGGSIGIRARHVQLAKGGSLSVANRMIDGFPAGDIDLEADESIAIDGKIDAAGGPDAGFVRMEAPTISIAGSVDVSAEGNAATAGDIEIAATRGVSIGGVLTLRDRSAYYDEGGSGGGVEVEVSGGDIDVAGSIDVGAFGNAYDEDLGPASAGSVILRSGGAIVVHPFTEILARGDNGLDYGGEISLESARGAAVAGTLEATGGEEGGVISIAAGGSVDVAGPLRARGESGPSLGGLVQVVAGEAPGLGSMPSYSTTAALALSSTIDVRALGCGAADDCSAAGEVSLTACDVSATAAARILARGETQGGSVTLTARHGLAFAGTVDATARSVAGAPGSVILRGAAALSLGGTSTPTAMSTIVAACTVGAQKDCLVPCPTCGDGAVAFPETCDDGGTLDCDGCSWACRSESCNDDNPCTTDACVPGVGCAHESLTRHVANDPSCPGDCDHDGAVTSADIDLLTIVLNHCRGGGCSQSAFPECSCSSADGNADGRISAAEFGRVLTNAGALTNGCP